MQPAVQSFLDWFRNQHPFVYDHAMNVIGASSVTLSGLGRPAGGRTLSGLGRPRGGLLSGLGDDAAASDPSAAPAPASTTSSLLDSLKSIAAPLIQSYQQQQLFNMNVDRAKQNLPPISADQMAAGVGVNVGLSPATKQLVIWGLIGVGGLQLISALTRRRSSA
jgi:hypothetical protein